MTTNRRWLLCAGAAFALLTGPRWHVPALAWIAPVPLLLFARTIGSWRGWLALLGVTLGAAILQVSTIATPPVPLVGVLAFALPLTLTSFASVRLAELIRRRVGEVPALFAYAASVAVLSWLGCNAEFGAWTSPTVTQTSELEFLQLAAIAGLPGLDFLMALFAAASALAIAERRFVPVAAVSAALIAGAAWSALRLDASLGTRHVDVAAVTTDLGMDEGGMPSDDRLRANTDTLFARTRAAAARGARLVVWNEVATVVHPAEEAPFVERGRAIARELHIDLVLAYAVLLTSDPILLDNKYLFIADDGTVLDEYRKHHPVPGEPSRRGEGPLHIVERPYGRVGGAICYDYDFPAIAREHARAGAELVVIPSSDWRGIDPNHTRMARIRAIEGGFSIVRSVRWAASGAFDAHGVTRAWMTTDDPSFVMTATVPVGRTPTLAAAIGDLPVALAAAYLVLAIALVIARRATPPAHAA